MLTIILKLHGCFVLIFYFYLFLELSVVSHVLKMPLHRGFWLAVRQAKYHGSAKTACLLRPLQFR